MKNKLLIALIISIVIFIVLVFMMILKPSEQVSSNKELNTTQIVALLKHTMRDLTVSPTLKDGSITTDDMIKFALSYMGVEGNYLISYTDNSATAIANKQDIVDVVKHIFNKEIDFTNTQYKTTTSSIYIPLNRVGTDAQIYKLSSKEYDEVEGTYKAYIDVLEVSAGQFNEIVEESVTEYNKQDVIFTQVFKYKIVDGRKILLAYNLISNW